MKTLHVITLSFAMTSVAFGQSKSEVDALLKEYFKNPEWSGVVGFVTPDGSVIYSYGYEDETHARPISQHTPFYLASVTKSFIGLLLMEQVADGNLSVNDTLGRWFPEFSPSLRRVTLAQMANHTAAIHDYHSLTDDGNGVTNEQVVTLLGQLDTTAYAPGARWGYSNSHYVLLAEILRRETNQPLEMLLRHNLCDRLHMLETKFTTERPDIVPSYDDRGRPMTGMSRTLGDAGLVVSGNDMMSQAEVLISDPHWSSLMKSAIDWGQVYDRDTTWTYTFGWFCSEDTRGKFCAHSGQGSGFQTYHRWYYDQGQYYFVLSNRYDGGIKLFRNSLSAIMED